MRKLSTIAERITKARQLIQEARDYPLPAQGGRWDLGYVAHIKDLLRQARALVQFIPSQPSATDAIKEDVKQIYKDIERTDLDLLRPGEGRGD